jgi:plastocyanin
LLRFRTLVVAAALAAVTLASTASSGAAVPKLAGAVGPGFTITLKQGTRAVRLLKPGRYTITVADKSNIHNFHLMGPGLNRVITTIGFVGTKTIVVSLMKGRYTFVCDPHFTSMKGSFAVS